MAAYADLPHTTSSVRGTFTGNAEGSDLPGPGLASNVAVAVRPAAPCESRAIRTMYEPDNVSTPKADSTAPATPPPPAVTALAFSRDSKWVASGSEDGRIIIRNVKSPDNKMQWPADPSEGSQVCAFSFSPMCDRLASAHDKGNIKLWSINCGPGGVVFYPIAENYPCATKPISAMDWSTDGRRIAACSEDGSLYIWHSSTKQFQRQPERPHYPYDSLAFVLFSPDSRFLLFGGAYNRGYIWDVEDPKVKQVVLFTADTHRKLLHANFDADGKHIITRSDNHNVRTWDSGTGAPRTADETLCPVWDVSFSPDGMRLVAGWGGERTIRFTGWKANPRMHLSRCLSVNVGSGTIKSARISPNGHFIASVSSNGTVHLTETSIATWQRRRGVI